MSSTYETGGSPPGTGTQAPPRRSAGLDAGDRSIGELLSQVGSDVSQLLSQEVALAKAEAKESAMAAGKGAGLLTGAGVAGWFVLLFLSLALWWWIGDHLGLGWSAVVVAAIWAVVAAILAASGRTQLKKPKGLPRTVETAKEIPDALRGHEENR